MRMIAVLAVLAAFVFVYIHWARPYLKSLPQFSEAWKQEESTWAAIVAWLDGRKTILAGIWGEFIGLAPDLLQTLSGVDLKTALSLPDNWAIIVSGVLVPMLMIIFRTKAK